MAKILTEDDIEKAFVGLLGSEPWGYTVLNAFTAEREDLGDGTGREDKKQCVLPGVVRESLARLNPSIPREYLEGVVGDLCEYQGEDGGTVGRNREMYRKLRNGVSVTYRDGAGRSYTELARLIDFERPERNDFCAVRQMWIRGVDEHWRRPDVILFVNGLPLVFVELKNADVKVENAYRENLQTYLREIPNLFAYNQVCILSNASETRVGGYRSAWEHFFEWLQVDAKGGRADREKLRRNLTSTKGCSLEILAKGLLVPRRLIDYIENFILFDDAKANINKILAKNHQYLGVNAAVENVKRRKALDGKLGVFFHTQGSGKSYSMVFFVRKIQRKLEGNFSYLIVTDRENLDKQISKTFVRCGVIGDGDPVHPNNSAELRNALSGNNFFTFTLIHKFRNAPGVEYPVLTERDDVIVIVDEAHRTQYQDLAANMRHGLPNANYIAFTGTPIEKTGAWFGGVVSEYNFADAIEDGSTLPIYYRNMAPHVELMKKFLDEDVDEIGDVEGLALDEREKLERHFAAEIEVLTRDERIQDNARKIVEHFVMREWRGKGMVVAVDRFTAVKYYQAVNQYWPEFRKKVQGYYMEEADEEKRAAYKAKLEYMDRVQRAVVISLKEDGSEEEEFERRGIGGLGEIRARLRAVDGEGADIEDNFKDPNHPLSLVFVCAMWLTGTDVPCLSTMYLDKPMKGHTLMQTIARVNRVYPGKNHGLIVDFVNIFKYVEKALGVYARPGSGRRDLPVKPIEELIDSLERSVEGTRKWLEGIGIDLGRVLKYPKDRGFDKIQEFKEFLDIIVSNDEIRNRFFIYTNKIESIWTASKPEVFDFMERVSKYLSPIRYLRKMMDTQVDRSRLDEAIQKVAQNLDARIKVSKDGAGEEAGIEVDLSKIDLNNIKKKFKKNPYQHLLIDDVRVLVEELLKKLLARNKTRIKFSEQYQQIVDDYNAGSVESEEALWRLLELLKAMKEEEKRAAANGMSEQQLEIFDLLCAGKKLTAAQEKAAKNAAKGLIEAIEKNPQEVFPLDWYKYQQGKTKVQGFITDVCAEALEGVFDLESFRQSTNRVYQLFLDRARDHKEPIQIAVAE